MQTIIEYFASKSTKFVVISQLQNGRRNELMRIAVEGKREARQWAKHHGAQPWNF